MNVMLVGGGAREHAIAEALKRGTGAKLYTVMKNRNPGIAKLSEEVLLEDETHAGEVADFASSRKVKLAVVGPETPLTFGVVDELVKRGIAAIGPTKGLARIESDKGFMRGLMEKYRVPCSLEFGVFDDPEEVSRFIDGMRGEVAIKPVGLTGGKGVKVVGEQLKDAEEAKNYAKEVIMKGIGGRESVVVEERAFGEEFTLQAFVDGEHVVPMPIVQDHKRAFEGDVGHNTGGMGSYSDSNGSLPFVSKKVLDMALNVMRKTVGALREETGDSYRGFLYGQFILAKELRLIEYNCRLGDPEAMNVLPLLKSDFVAVCEKIHEGTLSAGDVEFEKRATVCKYIVPEGYGVSSISGQMIEVDEEAVANEGARFYYASVNEESGKVYTTTSRSVGLVGIADSIAEAEEIAEKATRHVRGKHIYHRRDIGTKELIEKKMEHVKRYS